MAAAEAIVHVVDDDEAIRHSIVFQLETAGIAARNFASAEAFLEVVSEVTVGCVLTDVRMPGLGGLELVHRLHELNFNLPVIMMTGHGDIALAVQAMKAGAADFLEKPLNDEHLLRVVGKALAAAATPAEEAEGVRQLRSRFDSLSPREREVLKGVVVGQPNKVIAFDLGISPRTVEVYRGGLMAKSGAASLSQLVRMALTLGL
jgi:two-component system response regulator FixJ